MRHKLKVAFVGAALAGAAVAVIALAPSPADNSRDASRIIASLSLPQQASDKPPAPAMATINKMSDIDPSQIRLVGRGETLTYFAAPAGDKICMIPVDAQGEGPWVGCTLLQGFESYGLRLENADRTESGWLTVPAAAEKSLESIKDEGGWSQQASNFLVRNKH